ncbi:hypothetical protein [Streptomyces sp. NPDC046712]|uniref:hypothetical protein n=1 Tax=Streptomyces sp. NPDC046712 TaxID=3154802 RepID=UPI0033F63AD2
MPWKRTSSLLAAVLVAGLGLTACGSDGSDAKGGTATAPATSAPAADPTEGGADGGADSGSGKVAPPKDLPAGLPLPSGELTSVTGGAGAYVLTYRTPNPDGVLDEYRSALEGSGYTVVDIAGTFTATKGANAVQITTSGETVVLTLAGS